MLSKNSETLLVFLFLSFSISLFGQISINYSNPETIEVCDGGIFEISLQNGDIVSTNISVELRLPNGINYVAGSVTNVDEQDISNLNQPVFGVDDLNSGEAIRFTLNCV